MIIRIRKTRDGFEAHSPDSDFGGVGRTKAEARDDLISTVEALKSEFFNTEDNDLDEAAIRVKKKLSQLGI
jgi:hypothetical protein